MAISAVAREPRRSAARRRAPQGPCNTRMACQRRSIPFAREGADLNVPRGETSLGRTNKHVIPAKRADSKEGQLVAPPWIAVSGSPPRFILGVCCANRGSRSPSKEPCMPVTDVTQTRDASAFFTAGVADVDPEIAAAIKGELGRQRDEIELIASENIVSRAVLEAQGSVLTNKYAEGYPGRRYYGGCQFVDIAEKLAIERSTRLFGCAFANVQPHSGAQANQAAFMAMMQPGDTFMGLNLAAGGHLTHGSPVNLSGKWFHVVPYGVRRQDQRIDFEEVERLPHPHKHQEIVTPGRRA